MTTAVWESELSDCLSVMPPVPTEPLQQVQPPTLMSAAAATEHWYSQRSEYHQLLLEKRETFWKSKVHLEQSDPGQLWHSIDMLMVRGRGQTSAAVGAEDAHRFFDEKVAGVHASTDDVPPQRSRPPR